MDSDGRDPHPFLIPGWSTLHEKGPHLPSPSSLPPPLPPPPRHPPPPPPKQGNRSLRTLPRVQWGICNLGHFPMPNSQCLHSDFCWTCLISFHDWRTNLVMSCSARATGPSGKQIKGGGGGGLWRCLFRSMTVSSNSDERDVQKQTRIVCLDNDYVNMVSVGPGTELFRSGLVPGHCWLNQPFNSSGTKETWSSSMSPISDICSLWIKDKFGGDHNIWRGWIWNVSQSLGEDGHR